MLNWTSMMKDTLQKVKTPYILLALDDYFLTEQVDTEKLLNFVQLMKKNNITHIRITPATDGIEDYVCDNRFKVISRDSIYRTSLSPAIWNKLDFQRFLKDDENMWEFETKGRFREHGESLIICVKENTFHCVDRDNPDPKWHNLKSIEQGRWFEGAIKYVQEENLNINLTINPKDVNIEEIEKNIKNRQIINISKFTKIEEPIKIEEPKIEEPKIEPIKKNAIKILWLYQYMEDVNYDHWFHIDFAKAITNHKKIDLKCYGLNMERKYSEISLKYNPKKLFSDIKKEFDFDIIISNTKSRMFTYYCPPVLGHEERRNCWLPKDFSTWNKTPKISLEEDYHYELSDSWYVENNVNLILQRHYSQSQRKENIKKIWYPFSVDNKVFHPTNQHRIRKLCNIASSSSNCYPHRFKLIKILEPNGLLYNASRQIENNEYLEWLQRYVAYICCDSIYHITPAKMFEIMASGGLLFTNNSTKYGLQELFPKNCYLTYEENYSNVLKKVQLILNKKDIIDKIVENSIKCIEERHTNEIRINELLKIIRDEFKIS